MLGGNISNVVGDCVGVVCVGTVVKFKDSLLDKVASAIFGKYKRAYLDDKVLSFMNYLYRKTEITLDLIIFRDEKTDELMKFLEDSAVPYSRIVIVDRPVHITSRLMLGDLTYVLCQDTELLSLINHKWAMTLEKLSDILRPKNSVLKVGRRK